MSGKKIAIIGVIISVVIMGLLYVAISYIANLETEPNYPDLPIKSEQGKIIVTSDACCCGADDFKVVAVRNNGEELVLAEHDMVGFRDILYNEVPNLDNSFSNIVVSCTFIQAGKYKFKETILTNEDMEEVKKKGLLLNVDEDAGLNIRVGDRQISYGKISGKEKWKVLDVPKKLYK